MRRILLILAGLFLGGGLIALTVGLLVSRMEPSAAAMQPTLQRALVTAETIRMTGTLSVAVGTNTPSLTRTGLPPLTAPGSPPVSAVAQADQTQMPVVQTQTHLVQNGETLFRIAQRYGITVEALQTANDQIAPENLRAGTTLIIPLPVTVTPTGQPAGESTPTNTLLARTPLPTLTPSPIPTMDGTLSASSLTHTVRAGETLYRIAQQYGVTVDDIIRANNLADPDLLGRGTTLIIPVTVTIPPADLGIITVTTDTADASTATPTPSPWPDAINGVALDELLVMPPETWDHVLEIARRGYDMGRNGRAFSKLGDSTIENPHFLARFDGDDYNLGDYGFLQPAIDHFRGSFARESVAVQRGLNSFVVFDAMWARDESCPPDVGPLACEIALHNPAALFIRLGTNDREPEKFEANLRQIVQFTVDQGVIPLLGTKADERPGTTDDNDIIRRVAADMHVPLWDFARLAATLPDRGLTVDGIHLTTFYAHDYREPKALQTGYGTHNLLALMMLERIRPVLVAVNLAEG